MRHILTVSVFFINDDYGSEQIKFMKTVSSAAVGALFRAEMINGGSGTGDVTIKYATVTPNDLLVMLQKSITIMARFEC